MGLNSKNLIVAISGIVILTGFFLFYVWNGALNAPGGSVSPGESGDFVSLEDGGGKFSFLPQIFGGISPGQAEFPNSSQPQGGVSSDFGKPPPFGQFSADFKPDPKGLEELFKLLEGFGDLISLPQEEIPLEFQAQDIAILEKTKEVFKNPTNFQLGQQCGGEGADFLPGTHPTGSAKCGGQKEFSTPLAQYSGGGGLCNTDFLCLDTGFCEFAFYCYKKKCYKYCWVPSCYGKCGSGGQAYVWDSVTKSCGCGGGSPANVSDDSNNIANDASGLEELDESLKPIDVLTDDNFDFPEDFPEIDPELGFPAEEVFGDGDFPEINPVAEFESLSDEQQTTFESVKDKISEAQLGQNAGVKDTFNKCKEIGGGCFGPGGSESPKSMLAAAATNLSEDVNYTPSGCNGYATQTQTDICKDLFDEQVLLVAKNKKIIGLDFSNSKGSPDN